MDLTHAQKLRRILESISNREHSKPHRLKAARLLRNYFPPHRRTDLYALIIRDSLLTEEARWVAMLMLYHVGNDASIAGFIAFLEDPEMSRILKLNAATLLFSLNPRLKLKNAEHLPKFPLRWLEHGLSKLPCASEEERKEFVIDQLLINLFDEGTE